MPRSIRPSIPTVALTVLLAFLLAPLPKAGAQTVRYRLIDLGTFGGPNSAETVESPFVNNVGTVVGFADTALPDPFNPGGFIPHPFRWRQGVLTDLGTLPGGHGGFAIWSNDRGQVVGISDNGLVDPQLGGPEGIAALWQSDGRIFSLGTLGGTQSLAGGINANGQIIGVAANTIPDSLSLFGWATQTRAALWNQGKIQDLGTLGGTDASASYINDLGQITGNSYVDSNPGCPLDFIIPSPVTTYPFFWQNGTMTDIGTLGGNCADSAKINNRGQVVGTSTLPGDQTDHAFLWEAGTIKDLGTFGGTFAVGNWINDAGDVVGVASTSGDEEFHAFFWRNGVMTDLGVIGDDLCSIAHFLNARGQVVGTSGCIDDQFEVHGFLWQPGGSIIDLNAFVPPGLDLQITDGQTINDSGEIAASGLLPNGDFHAVLLVPCGTESTDANCRAADFGGPPSTSANSAATTESLRQTHRAMTTAQLLAKLRAQYLLRNRILRK